MRAISIIFRRELGTYLRSWLGYIVGALALLISGIVFQALALDDKARLSADVLAYFFQLMSVATLVISVVLAIRLVAEERQQHTMVLLNTSPVRDVEIIAGKFLAAFVFLALIICASVYMPLLIKVRGKVSMEQIYVGYLGLLLLGATGLSMGLFASSLTRHQLVAAAVGAALAFVLSVLYKLGQSLDAPLKSTISSLDIWWRYNTGFSKGVLNLSDVIFYLAVTYFFLLLSTKTLEAKRWQ